MEPDSRFLPTAQRLQPEELELAARACVGLGIRHIRLTGGEPTLHPQLPLIISRMARLDLDDLSMTTNGWRLDNDSLRNWHDHGLRRLTVSLDAVTDARFQQLTRSSVSPQQIIDGIRRAIECGLGPVKVNAVIIRNWNEDQVVPLASLARKLDIEVRFIEFMPLDAGRHWSIDSVVPAAEILDRIRSVFALRELHSDDPATTAIDFGFEEGSLGRIGLIAPVSRPFCGACNRLRITADGKVRPCLFSTTEWDMLPLMRNGASVRQIQEFLIDAVWTKQAGHGITSAAFERPERSMSAIGG